MEIIHCESRKDIAAWQEYVRCCPQATLFHTWPWRDIAAGVYGLPSFYLMAKQDDQVCGILPLILIKGPLFGASLVSMPFADYGGICASTTEATAGLVDAALELGRSLHVQYIELRQSTLLGLGLPCRSDKVTMVLPLRASEGQMWNRLPSERRNKIRKGLNGNVTAELLGPEALDSFYDVYAETMRDLGSPGHSKLFFRAIFDASPESIRIGLVRSMGKAIGAGICLRFKESLLTEYSSLKRYRKLQADILLNWEAMKYGIAHGAREIDFGRSTIGSGTFEFKRNWGATPRQLYWQYILLNRVSVPHVSSDNGRYGVLIEIWKRIPVRLAKTIGPILRRSIPA